MSTRVSRRNVLAGTAATVGAAFAGTSVPARALVALESERSSEPFRYCLNMGTIMGHKLDPAQEADIAAKAGYSGIEPWVRNLRQYVEAGHSAADLRKQIADAGLTVEGAIGFASWAVEDETQRKKGLDEFKRDMELVASIGGKRIAAPPAGINRTPGVDLNRVAERYRAVLELGREMGVIPQLEIWGSALTLGRMSEAIFVAVQADHPDACLLLDAYHLFRGNSGFHGLKLLCGSAMHVFHINDYPAEPAREELTDAHRIYPGDGVAPLDQILRDLQAHGLPRSAIAGTVQSRLLAARRPAGRSHRPGKDACRRAEGTRQEHLESRFTIHGKTLTNASLHKSIVGLPPLAPPEYRGGMKRIVAGSPCTQALPPCTQGGLGGVRGPPRSFPRIMKSHLVCAERLGGGVDRRRVGRSVVNHQRVLQSQRLHPA